MTPNELNKAATTGDGRIVDRRGSAEVPTTLREGQFRQEKKEILEVRYKTNLLLAVGAIAATTVMTTPASARQYICNDGTVVTYESSCKGYGGCCQKQRLQKPGTARRQGISDQGAAGNLSNRSRQKVRDGLPERNTGGTFPRFR